MIDVAWYKDLWEYDPTTDQWTKKVDFPGEARYLAVGFSIGDLGYVGTGQVESGSNSADFWAYNPTIDQWTRVSPLGNNSYPAIERQQAVSFVIGDKAYVGTGKGEKKNLWESDATTDRWTQKTDFGGGGRGSAIGFAMNGKGYIGTEYVNGVYQKDMWAYNPTTDSWT
ncbi:hypothetical protein BKI52_43405 [marine bacterium AO1-C]|nr:hypothetical protein BKI52_43405 [marine bacterium AO1-C]